MSNSRYHIHLACAPDDVSIQTAQDDLSVFFENKAFITRDLLVVGQESASYSRRCVNECDLVVLIVGNEYGQVNQSGVSQSHLTYTNAKAKKKPMLIFVSHDPDNLRSRHLVDLISSIQSQSVTPQPNLHTVYFHAQQGLKQVLPLAFDNLNLSTPKWHSYKQEQVLVDAKTAIETAKNPEEMLDIELLEGILSNHKIDLDLSTTSLMSLDDEVSLDCTAHVFEGGTLIEVEFIFTLTWRRALQALEELKLPFSEQGLSRCLNELIDKHQVDTMIMAQHPKAHAISRHQIKKSELSRVKAELQSAGWIVSPGSNMLWIVSDDIKQIQQGGINGKK